MMMHRYVELLCGKDIRSDCFSHDHRTCLSCGRVFHSSSLSNRRCQGCKDKFAEEERSDLKTILYKENKA